MEEESRKREQMLAQWSLASPKPWGTSIPPACHFALSFPHTHTHTHSEMQTQPRSPTPHLQTLPPSQSPTPVSHAPPLSQFGLSLQSTRLTGESRPRAVEAFTACSRVHESTDCTLLERGRPHLCQHGNTMVQPVNLLSCHHRWIVEWWQQIQMHSHGRNGSAFIINHARRRYSHTYAQHTHTHTHTHTWLLWTLHWLALISCRLRFKNNY